MKQLIILTLFCTFFIAGCKKEEPIIQNNALDLDAFISLKAQKDILTSGETTLITATITGGFKIRDSKIKYSWYVTGGGELIGDGSQALFLALPCSVGDNKVTCKVYADNKIGVKSIIITVLKRN